MSSLPLGALALAVALHACDGAPHRDGATLTGKLACGMSELELRKLAAANENVRLTVPSDSGNLSLRIGTTVILLELRNGALATYQLSWTEGFMKRRHALKRDICRDVPLVEVHVIGGCIPSQPGRVLLDGRVVGSLVRAGAISLDVPLGDHDLRIDWPNGATWTAQLHYGPASDGYDRVDVDLSNQMPGCAT